MGNLAKMAKSKNHTSHNQGYKNHRNGIFKVKRERYMSHHMVNQKLCRNTRRARKFDPSIKKNVNITKKIQARRDIKAQVLAKIKQAKIAKVVKTTGKPAKKDDKKDKKPAAPAKKK